MKKLGIVFFIGVMLSGCTDKKAVEKAALDSVIAVHDKVMALDEQLMKNKMLLDTLIKQKGFSGSDTAKLMFQKLTLADSAMDDWMHDFNYEQKGKSHDEILAYMAQQKKLIMHIDTQISTAVNASNKFITQIKSK